MLVMTLTGPAIVFRNQLELQQRVCCKCWSDRPGHPYGILSVVFAYKGVGLGWPICGVIRWGPFFHALLSWLFESFNIEI